MVVGFGNLKTRRNEDGKCRKRGGGKITREPPKPAGKIFLFTHDEKRGTGENRKKTINTYNC